MNKNIIDNTDVVPVVQSFIHRAIYELEVAESYRDKKAEH